MSLLLEVRIHTKLLLPLSARREMRKEHATDKCSRKQEDPKIDRKIIKKNHPIAIFSVEDAEAKFPVQIQKINHHTPKPQLAQHYFINHFTSLLNS